MGDGTAQDDTTTVHGLLRFCAFLLCKDVNITWSVRKMESLQR